MKSELFYNITQLIRTLLPVFAAIGTITSAVGFWRIFNKWRINGIYSLIPFVRGWIFGKDSKIIPRIFYAVSDGIIVVLTPIFYYLRVYGNIEEYTIGKFVIYVDRAMLIVIIIWVLVELIRFFSSIHIAANLCKKNNRGKGWIFSWVLIPQFTKIVWGFSNKFIKEFKEELK